MAFKVICRFGTHTFDVCSANVHLIGKIPLTMRSKRPREHKSRKCPLKREPYM